MKVERLSYINKDFKSQNIQDQNIKTDSLNSNKESQLTEIYDPLKDTKRTIFNIQGIRTEPFYF